MIQTLDRTAEVSDPASVDEEVSQYLTLGHTGYILAYRAKHDGADPDAAQLQFLARKADNRRCGRFARIIKGIVDALT